MLTSSNYNKSFIQLKININSNVGINHALLNSHGNYFKYINIYLLIFSDQNLQFFYGFISTQWVF